MMVLAIPSYNVTVVKTCLIAAGEAIVLLFILDGDKDHLSLSRTGRRRGYGRTEKG